MRQRYVTAIVKVSIVALLAGFSTVNAGTIPEVPEALKVPATQVLSFETQAVGVQIYECKVSKDDPARFEWVFKAPEAELFDSAGKRSAGTMPVRHGNRMMEAKWSARLGRETMARIATPSHGCC